MEKIKVEVINPHLPLEMQELTRGRKIVIKEDVEEITNNNLEDDVPVTKSTRKRK